MIKPDMVQFASAIDTFLNYETTTANVTISGSVADGNSKIFQTTIPYSRQKTRADIYVKNMNTGVKRPINGGPRTAPYQYVSFETIDQYAQYNSNSIIVTFVVTNNTGGLINLTSQTFQVSVVLYVVPY